MNMDEIMKKREQVSALADGQLDGAEFADAVEFAAADDDARASWHVYHVVGDVLRSRELAACGRDRDFAARLAVRLRAEPGAPKLMTGPAEAVKWVAGTPAKLLASGQESRQIDDAANDGSFRWKLVAGFASLAAVAAMGWSALGALDGASSSGGQLAQSGAAPAVAMLAAAPAGREAVASLAQPGEQVMIRDPRLDELLAAHRQFGGISALQNPSGFLRNATFEGAAR